MDTRTDALIQIGRNARDSVVAKVAVIAVMMMVLMIPKSMIMALINEREERRNSTVGEIESKWGNEQLIAGPVLTIPIRSYYRGPSGVLTEQIEYAHFLPEALRITGRIDPHLRYRGIYKAVLYNAQFTLDGVFSRPDISRLKNVPPENILFDEAVLSVGVSDLRGIKERIFIQFNGETVDLEPGDAYSTGLDAALSAKIALKPSQESDATLAFSIPVNVNGSSSLTVLPLGKDTEVRIESEWPDPSFCGSFLPENRTVDESGFRAQWKINYLNRKYPQQWTGGGVDFSNSGFGVQLLLPVDTYQKISRTAKYAVLFILLTFLTFFIIEILYKICMHPIQYLLIGMAVCLFYSLLLSVSEHLRFGIAYLLSSMGVLAMIMGYTYAVTRRKFLAGLVGLVFMTLYGFLYILLQLQDYSLLIGNLGLFVILSVIMYVTRNIDWYGIGDKPTTSDVADRQPPGSRGAP